MRRCLPVFAIVCVAAMLLCQANRVLAADAKAPAKIRVLMLSGDDVMPAHDWHAMTEATRDILMEAGKFDVRVSDDPMILDSEKAVQAYDVIHVMLYNRTLPTISDQAKENLLKFAKQGKGVVIQHLASASFAEWDEFKKLCGRYWKMKTSGHGPRSVFEVKVIGKEHPITKGIGTFKTDDELYAKLLGDEPIEVLAQADSDWSKQTEPLVFVRPYGQGRVFHHCFGHDAKALATPEVRKIIARGVEWAATGKVAE